MSFVETAVGLTQCYPDVSDRIWNKIQLIESFRDSDYSIKYDHFEKAHDATSTNNWYVDHKW